MFTLQAVPRSAATASPKRAKRCSIVSGATQEVIVDVARRRLVVPRPKKPTPAPPPPPPSEPETEQVTRKEEGSQTEVSYCLHECAKHPRVNGHGNGSGAGNVKAKNGKNGKAEANDADKHATDDSGKDSDKSGANGGGKKKKGKGKEHAHVYFERDSSDSESESDSGTGIKKKVRIDPDVPFGKGSGSKGGKKNNGQDTWDPTTLPYLTSLLHTPNKFSKAEKQVLDRHAQRSREALAASRNADEEKARRWVSEQLAATHSGALRWLRERDLTRQTAATAATTAFFDPTELKVALEDIEGVGRMGPARAFPNVPVLKATPDPNTPLWAFTEDLGPITRCRRDVSTPLVLLQDNNHISTLDGRPVRIVQRTSLNAPFRTGGPLQQTSGNVAVPPTPPKNASSNPPPVQTQTTWAANEQDENKDSTIWRARDNSNNEQWPSNDEGWDNAASQPQEIRNNEQNADNGAGAVTDTLLGISYQPAGNAAPTHAPTW